MTNIKEVYKCETCGNILEVIKSGNGTPECCGKPMKLMEENTSCDKEHIPIMEKVENGVSVKIGSNMHPMTDTHYIQFIEVITPNKLYRKYLKPGDNPQAVFNTDEEALFAREYCSLHGLWKK